jgi:hypothetical protein
MSERLRLKWLDLKRRWGVFKDETLALFFETMDEHTPNWRTLPEKAKRALVDEVRQEVKKVLDGKFGSLDQYLTRSSKMAIYECTWEQAKQNHEWFDRRLLHIAQHFKPDYQKKFTKAELLKQADQNIEDEERQLASQREQQELREKQEAQEKERQEQAAGVRAEAEAEVGKDAEQPASAEPAAAGEDVEGFWIEMPAPQADLLNKLLDRAVDVGRRSRQETLVQAVSEYVVNHVEEALKAKAAQGVKAVK